MKTNEGSSDLGDDDAVTDLQKMVVKLVRVAAAKQATTGSFWLVFSLFRAGVRHLLLVPSSLSVSFVFSPLRAGLIGSNMILLSSCAMQPAVVFLENALLPLNDH